MKRDFTIIDAPQRSPEWFAARLGRVTGSKASCVMMGEKTAGRADYVMQLALERLTGTPEEGGYVSAEMQRGIDKEPLARMRAEATGEFIRETGFISHNTLMIGASLDGDSDDFKRIWEFKNPKSTTHVKYLRSDGALLVADYQYQMTHNILVTSAEFGVFGSFDDRMPVGLEWVQREMKARDLPLDEYWRALEKFLADVASLEAELRAMLAQRAPQSITTFKEEMATTTTALQIELAPASEPITTDDANVADMRAEFEQSNAAERMKAVQSSITTGTGVLQIATDGMVTAIDAESMRLSVPTLRLGQISERLGFAVTAAFLLSLGFEHADRERASMLYHESDFSAICAALLRHVEAVKVKF